MPLIVFDIYISTHAEYDWTVTQKWTFKEYLQQYILSFITEWLLKKAIISMKMRIKIYFYTLQWHQLRTNLNFLKLHIKSFRFIHDLSSNLRENSNEAKTDILCPF